VREVAIVELQKRVNEGEGRLKQQQALYEAVRADRNLYSKTLIEAQDEINELKRKFKIQAHQVGRGAVEGLWCGALCRWDGSLGRLAGWPQQVNPIHISPIHRPIPTITG